MYKIYKILTFVSAPILSHILKRRVQSGKEIPNRVLEKHGITSKVRPSGKLIWFHAASVGEAQSTLILINKILERNQSLNILVTTGTITSANAMDNTLPKQAFHQFYPLDHPKWVSRFINHWNPDFIIWMESELWPNMLHEIKDMQIPAILINAHMSNKSYSLWLRLPSLINKMLSSFNKILCQNDIDKELFDKLGAKKTIVTDNLKYSSDLLKYNDNDLDNLKKSINNRPIWLYASTHKGEETLACKTHLELKKHMGNVLTIIVPRHPERRDKIKDACKEFDLNIKFRGHNKQLPDINSDIYIADTLGELGLFYRLSDIAMIGRTFSDDGGGGHNPIEAAQLNCGVLHGSNVQNLQAIFDKMNKSNAAICIDNPDNLANELLLLFTNNDKLLDLQNSGKAFSNHKNNVIDIIMDEVTPLLEVSKCL